MGIDQYYSFVWDSSMRTNKRQQKNQYIKVEVCFVFIFKWINTKLLSYFTLIFFSLFFSEDCICVCPTFFYFMSKTHRLVHFFSFLFLSRRVFIVRIFTTHHHCRIACASAYVCTFVCKQMQAESKLRKKRKKKLYM